jgi:hypothetical protein
MLVKTRYKWTLYFLAMVGVTLSTQAYAAKDVFYPSGSSATINGAAATVSNNFSGGSDGATTLTPAANPGNSMSVQATWSIQDRSAQPGTDSTYPQAATFSFSTTSKPAGAPNVAVTAVSNCTLTSSGSTCVRDFSFTAPATVGNYQVLVTPGNLGGATGLAAKTLAINFTIVPAVVEKLATKLTVAKQCVLLNQGDVDLTGKLEELASSNPVSGANLEFFINPEPDANGFPTVPAIGSANTESNGVATLSYNVNGLSVGDYNLYGQFEGDSVYKPSNDSDILGVSYVFAGFRQPINADGTSIFGGRVIPIKIKLADANGLPVTDAQPTVWLTAYSASGLGEVLEQVSSVSAADTGNIMRYVPEEQQYIYNWDATELVNGTYAVVVDLGDSSACRQGNPYAIITVNKKGKK